MMNIAYDTKKMTDYYLLFKTKDQFEKWIKHEAVPSARFKAFDYVDFKTRQDDYSNVKKNNRENLTIKTSANLSFTNNDWIYDIKAKQLWKLISYTLADDGQMKEYSRRPRTMTILELER